MYSLSCPCARFWPMECSPWQWGTMFLFSCHCQIWFDCLLVRSVLALSGIYIPLRIRSHLYVCQRSPGWTVWCTDQKFDGDWPWQYLRRVVMSWCDIITAWHPQAILWPYSKTTNKDGMLWEGASMLWWFHYGWSEANVWYTLHLITSHITLHITSSVFDIMYLCSSIDFTTF